MKPSNSLQGHPIIAAPNSPIQNIKFSFVPKLISCSKVGVDFLKKLPKNIDPIFTPLTCNIIGLYTNIPYESDLRALNYYQRKYRKLSPIRFN